MAWIARESTRCASMGWSAPSIRHSIWRARHTETALVFSAISLASTRAAEIFGLYPKKGEIAIGSDADLVIWDPAYRGTISAATHSMATDYSAWEGWPVEGRPELVTVRGKIMVRDGTWCGETGWGKFLPRCSGGQ